MRHFRTVFLLSLAALGCGSATGGPDVVDTDDAGPDSHLVSSGGAAGSEDVGTGGADTAGSAGAGGDVGVGGNAGAGGDGGTAGAAGDGGSSGAAGDGGSSGASQGGSAGDAGAGGTAGVGGTGGTGGTAGVGGTGGSAGAGGSTSDPPPPACTFTGTRCNGLLFETCTLDEGVAQYSSTQCGVSPEVGMMCDETGGCVGECPNGDVRCNGTSVETCGSDESGSWFATEECDFQCVDGACQGACTPGNAVCDGASVVTCGEDFRFSNPVACPADVNATATCSGAGECETACVPGFDDCSAAAGCETDLSSPDSCGSCGNVCPSAANATRTCNGGVCGLTPNACSTGTANCTGDFVCETPTSDDENNCGGCGVKCFGTCTEGVCDVETVADLAASSASDYAVDLVLDGGYVYWWTYNLGANTILRAPKTGGTPETLTTFSELTIGPSDNALLVDNGQIYWATPTGVFRKPVAGGVVQRLSYYGAASLAIDGGKLYWNDSHANTTAVNCLGQHFGPPFSAFQDCNAFTTVTFYTVNLATLVQTSWQTVQYEYSNVLGVQGSELFVARFRALNVNGDHHYRTLILTLDVATGAPIRSIVSGARIDGTLVDLGDFFSQAVFTGASLVFKTNLGIFQAPLSVPGEASLVASYGPSNLPPEYLAADADHIYLSSPGLSVSRISRSTLAAETLFGSPGNAYSKIAVDDSYVYWTVFGTNRSILRAAK